MKKKIVLLDIDYTIFNTDIFKKSKFAKHTLYDEVLNTLGEVAKIAELGIFSEGEITFQKEKLLKTDIEKHFSEVNITIVSDKLSDIEMIIRKYEDYKIILVDDKVEVLKKAKNILPSITTVWVERGPYAKNSKAEELNVDYAISDLSGLGEIVSPL